MKFLKVFALFTTGLVDHQLMLRIFFCKFVSRHVKRKISKIELLTRGQNNNKLWYNYRKGVITASKAHSNLTKMNKILKPTGGCVNMWLLCQNISGLLLINPDLHALKHDQTVEMEATNAFFELMKMKHKSLVISECGLFSGKANCFLRKSPDRLMTCDCCEYACVEIKCPLSISYEKLNQKNLDYSYKSDSDIKLKNNHSYFTQYLLQMAGTNRKLCYFAVWTRHGKVIDTKSFDGLWRGYSVSTRLVKLIRFQGFPLQLPGYQDLVQLLFVLSYQL